MTTTLPTETAPLLDTMRRFWGYDEFRPLQREAMLAVMRDRDSVVVMPTGGGKSLCYQIPALCKPGLAVVISPLISLMKDQVDALEACGVAAACANSSQSVDEKRRVAERIRGGELKLLYLSPERLLSDKTLEFLQSVPVSFLAIDEAHCISEWGHDFRPEYRQLKVLRQRFPKIAIHCYTATATEKVRDDIARQLGFEDHELLVGSFDRPNLIYHVARRNDRLAQIVEVIARHKTESGIVYCIRRADVEEIAAQLNAAGYRALPYHAGLSDQQRKSNQEAFIQERVETIVATVAFGMGIDKSNVRYVVHAGLPKSLENYQQESGRAGRDGLEAECHLLYSAGDVVLWKRMLGELPPEARLAAEQSLVALDAFCTGHACRHRALVRYFGQLLEQTDCGACDFCLGDHEPIEEPLIVAQKILSCVVRLNERFGAGYTVKVLVGSRDKRILEQQHEQLSTYGLLMSDGAESVRDWIEQLVSQEFLTKTGEYSVLKLTDAGRKVLRGEVVPRLIKTAAVESSRSAPKKNRADVDWEGVDRGLFDALREVRRCRAEELGLPAYIVFGDATLRELARDRPTTLDRFGKVRGVGAKKCADFGEEFVRAIAEYAREHGLETDRDARPIPPARLREGTSKISRSSRAAFVHFAEGKSIAEVAKRMGRAESTAQGYLADYLKAESITDPTPWVPRETAERIEQTATETSGEGGMRAIFEKLQPSVTYNDIRIVLICRNNRGLGDSRPA